MRIAEYFSGKNIFITGGTGFLGKVLIEKLLRSCPDVGDIYILIRDKKGKSIDQRMDLITSLPLFDVIREQNPTFRQKIIPIKGDVTEVNLGLSPADRQMLVEKVNIIYHTAASVRFDDFLKDAIFINVRGTREVSQLALDLKNISLFVHISTTYCNIDKTVIEEKLYPPHADWRDAIEVAEHCDDKLIKTLTEKYIQPLPNTYTFAKSLAEHVVNDMCTGKIPAIIIRPSVVISTLDEPILGWNDNLNGPMGLLLAGGKGLLRTVLGNTKVYTDYIPVDVTIKVMLAATRESANKILTEIEVINISQGSISRVNTGGVMDMGRKVIQEFPFAIILWYPRFQMTNCWYNYFIQVLLFHMLPALFIDFALKLSGRKPMLFNIQRKIYIANVVLSPFLSDTWLFKNEKLFILKKTLYEDEEDTFGVAKFDLNKKDQYNYLRSGTLGAMKYVLKEDYSPEYAKKNTLRMWYLDVAVKTLFYIFIFWLFIKKINIAGAVFDSVENYFKNLN